MEAVPVRDPVCGARGLPANDRSRLCSLLVLLNRLSFLFIAHSGYYHSLLGLGSLADSSRCRPSGQRARTIPLCTRNRAFLPRQLPNYTPSREAHISKNFQSVLGARLL